MLDKNKIKSKLAAGESVGTLVGAALAQRVARVRDELRAEIDALAGENAALKAQLALVQKRIADLERRDA
jgi:hypothetical protein